MIDTSILQDKKALVVQLAGVLGQPPQLVIPSIIDLALEIGSAKISNVLSRLLSSRAVEVLQVSNLFVT